MLNELNANAIYVMACRLFISDYSVVTACTLQQHQHQLKEENTLDDVVLNSPNRIFIDEKINYAALTGDTGQLDVSTNTSDLVVDADAVTEKKHFDSDGIDEKTNAVDTGQFATYSVDEEANIVSPLRFSTSDLTNTNTSAIIIGDKGDNVYKGDNDYKGDKEDNGEEPNTSGVDVSLDSLITGGTEAITNDNYDNHVEDKYFDTELTTGICNTYLISRDQDGGKNINAKLIGEHKYNNKLMESIDINMEGRDVTGDDQIPSCSTSRTTDTELKMSGSRRCSIASLKGSLNETKDDTMRRRVDMIAHAQDEEEEFTVSDIYKQATLIGQDIEEINNVFGHHVAESLMPKLIFVLDRLECALLQHNDNKSKIKALLLEQDDLEAQKRTGEEKNKTLAAHLDDTESIVETSERKLEMKVKLLKMENKVLSKTVKKKNKKIKTLQKGPGGAGMLWLVDKFLFSGRLFFVTRELPRDIAAIEKLDGVITTQKREIHRLSSVVEMNEQERERVEKDVKRLSFVNEYLEHENNVIKTRLSRIDWDSTSDSFKRAATNNAATNCAEPIFSNDVGGDSSVINVYKFDYDSNDKLYFQNGTCVSISDEASESRYWDVLSNSSKTQDEDESFVFELSADVKCDEDVKTKMAMIGFQDDYDECDNAKIVEIIKTKNEHVKTKNENDSTNGVGEEAPETNHSQEVKVDIHENRKDYKKLLLAQELRDSIAIITERNNVNNYEHIYGGGERMDVKHENHHPDETRYWHEVDSKSSQEDLVKCNEKSPNHLYFILDKDNKSAKKVGLDEYQTVLRRSISSSKISKLNSSENNLGNDNLSFDITTIQQQEARVRTNSAIPMY